MKPTRKVGASALAGAISVVGVYVIEQISHASIPAAVAAAGTTICTFVVGYFVPESEG